MAQSLRNLKSLPEDWSLCSRTHIREPTTAHNFSPRRGPTPSLDVFTHCLNTHRLTHINKKGKLFLKKIETRSGPQVVGWPQTHDDSVGSASQVLAFLVWVTTSNVMALFYMQKPCWENTGGFVLFCFGLVHAWKAAV